MLATDDQMLCFQPEIHFPDRLPGNAQRPGHTVDRRQRLAGEFPTVQTQPLGKGIINHGNGTVSRTVAHFLPQISQKCRFHAYNLRFSKLLYSDFFRLSTEFSKSAVVIANRVSIVNNSFRAEKSGMPFLKMILYFFNSPHDIPGANLTGIGRTVQQRCAASVSTHSSRSEHCEHAETQISATARRRAATHSPEKTFRGRLQLPQLQINRWPCTKRFEPTSQ